MVLIRIPVATQLAMSGYGESWLQLGASLNRVEVDHVGSAPGAGGDAIEDQTIELLGCVDRIWQHHGFGMCSAKVAQDGMVDGGSMPFRMHSLYQWRCAMGVIKGKGTPWVDTEWIDPSRWGQVTPLGALDQLHSKHYRVSQSWRLSRVDRTSQCWGLWGPLFWQSSVAQILPFQKGRPHTVSRLLKFAVYGPVIRREFPRRE